MTTRWTTRVSLGPDFRVLRDPIFTTQGPQVNYVRQVDFRWKGRSPPCGGRGGRAKELTKMGRDQMAVQTRRSPPTQKVTSGGAS